MSPHAYLLGADFLFPAVLQSPFRSPKPGVRGFVSHVRVQELGRLVRSFHPSLLREKAHPSVTPPSGGSPGLGRGVFFRETLSLAALPILKLPLTFIVETLNLVFRSLSERIPSFVVVDCCVRGGGVHRRFLLRILKRSLVFFVS